MSDIEQAEAYVRDNYPMLHVRDNYPMISDRFRAKRIKDFLAGVAAERERAAQMCLDRPVTAGEPYATCANLAAIIRRGPQPETP